ncbi:hypothetical protein PR202_ga06959 [Eleusine coracana subsp. coracana]|uniref:Secreted protein n=1 Tax=Eleusine coracana subsp. coracana TaxID=191504 RepID=A0AAV5BWA3_ELECO|nr:hypothetical protein PR202_ga06959 [Eleusine coracana subsp. coracana]
MSRTTAVVTLVAGGTLRVINMEDACAVVLGSNLACFLSSYILPNFLSFWPAEISSMKMRWNRRGLGMDRTEAFWPFSYCRTSSSGTGNIIIRKELTCVLVLVVLRTMSSCEDALGGNFT